MTQQYDEGDYHAKVVGQRFEESSTGSLMLVLELLILGRYTAGGEQEEPRPQKRKCRQTLNEIGFRILNANFKAMGVEVRDLTLLQPGQPGHVSLVGKEVDATCHHEPFEGRTVERWAIDRPRASLGDIQSLQRQFGHLLGDGVVGFVGPALAGDGEVARAA